MDGTETEPAMVGKKAAQTSAKTPVGCASVELRPGATPVFDSTATEDFVSALRSHPSGFTAKADFVLFF